MFDSFTKGWELCLDPVNKVPTLNCVYIAMNNIINAMIVLSGIVAVFFIIFAGFKFIYSRGDPEAIESAKHTMMYAIAGLIFIVLVFFIFNFVFNVLGLSSENYLKPQTP